MSSKRAKFTGKGNTKPFLRLPKDVWSHPKFVLLPAPSVKLLLDIAGQYNGKNNGDLHAAWSLMMKDRGWKSKDTLHRALGELMKSGLLIRTRQGKRYGGTHFPSLYAVAWEAIDTSDKHDMATVTAPNTFKEVRL